MYTVRNKARGEFQDCIFRVPTTVWKTRTIENGFRANYTIALNVRCKPVFRKTTVGGDKEKPQNSKAHGIFSKRNGMLFLKSYNIKTT